MAARLLRIRSGDSITSILEGEIDVMASAHRGILAGYVAWRLRSREGFAHCRLLVLSFGRRLQMGCGRGCPLLLIFDSEARSNSHGSRSQIAADLETLSKSGDAAAGFLD